MKLGRHHNTKTRHSASTGKLLLVVEFEFVPEENDMTDLGNNSAKAAAAIKSLLSERTGDRQKISDLQTQVAGLQTKVDNSIPTDAEANTAIADLGTVVADLPADVLAAATAPVPQPAPPADGATPPVATAPA